MSGLRVGIITLPSATLGPVNPLPPLTGAPQLHANVAAADLDDEMRANLEHGRVASLLPYLLQDRYDRTLVPREHRVAVLENDRLRAEFLLDLGGRLRSLVDITSGRELLYANPAFQPANLALRGAWFAGGVEWNVGIRGHTPLTCAPVFAARVDGPDGVPVLRMWEYERIREVVYQIDCWLPEGSPVLVVAVRILNLNDHAVPMYWWSNVAVPESSDVRVLAPGDAAWRFDETASVRLIRLPIDGGDDRTYPARATGAADCFVRLDGGRRPWVAAVDGTGSGLAQSSTPELRGRKLFVWGGGTGGGHWQEWLSPLGGRYFEIQAGLLRTQLEHVPMPARAEWAWVETYGPVRVDPAIAHGADWSAARDSVERALTASVPDEWLADRRDEAARLSAQAPTELLHAGSGWGALEHRLRGDGAMDRPATPFPADSLGPEQTAWLGLVESGRLPAADPSEAPGSYQVGRLWADRLERSGAEDWATWLHRGVARHHAGDVDGAISAWRRSNEAAPNAWALRNLAVVTSDPMASIALFEKAFRLAPDQPAVLAELIEALVDDDNPTAALAVVEAAKANVAADPLVQFLEARAAVAIGDVGRAQGILGAVPMPWVREGSRSLDDLWFRLEACRVAQARGVVVDDALLEEVRREAPLPYAYDFRMSAGAPVGLQP
jgi:tetratricopeptide (TPR) repeat protein